VGHWEDQLEAGIPADEIPDVDIVKELLKLIDQHRTNAYSWRDDFNRRPFSE
jgi:hypothetical protein